MARWPGLNTPFTDEAWIGGRDMRLGAQTQRHSFTEGGLPGRFRGELPHHGFLSVGAIAVANVSAGLLVALAFPNTEMARDYLTLLGKGADHLGTALNATVWFLSTVFWVFS